MRTKGELPTVRTCRICNSSSRPLPGSIRAHDRKFGHRRFDTEVIERVVRPLCSSICGCSSMVERLPSKQDVASSSLVSRSTRGSATAVLLVWSLYSIRLGAGDSDFPHRTWGCSSVGRAPALQAGGRGFESHHFHHSCMNPVGCGSSPFGGCGSLP